MTAPWNSTAVREAFPPYTLRDLGDGVRRITAPNPGPLTGPGTNTYLVGEQAVAVIDPGVRDTRHLDTILAAADGRIRWILLTHTHPDHSPGARELAEATGARMYSHHAELQGARDADFTPDQLLDEGDVVEGEGLRLRVLFTPAWPRCAACAKSRSSAFSRHTAIRSVRPPTSSTVSSHIGWPARPRSSPGWSNSASLPRWMPCFRWSTPTCPPHCIRSPPAASSHISTSWSTMAGSITAITTGR